MCRQKLFLRQQQHNVSKKGRISSQHTCSVAHITRMRRRTKGRVWGSLTYRSPARMASWKVHHISVRSASVESLTFFAWLPLIWHFVIKNLTVGIRIHKQNNTSRKPSIQKWNLFTQTVWDSRPQSQCIMRHSMSGQITLSDGCIFLVCASHSII